MKKRSLLDSIEVKSPCSESWDEMSGNEHVRFCSHCAKHVHNLSAMTHRDAMKLVSDSKGGICIRYVKRSNGTMATVDRPIHQIKRRARIAAGAIAATMAVSTLAYSQGEARIIKPPATSKKENVSHYPSDLIVLTVNVIDQNGAILPGAKVTLLNTKTKESMTSVSDSEGRAIFKLKETGKFWITSEAQGFKNLIVTDLTITHSLEANITHEFSEETVVVGIYSCDLPGAWLDIAISENDYERVRDALKDGAELNPRDRDSEYPPPLHQAVTLGYKRIVKLLLDYGANPNLRTVEGITPFDCASTEEMRELLQEYGAKEF